MSEQSIIEYEDEEEEEEIQIETFSLPEEETVMKKRTIGTTLEIGDLLVANLTNIGEIGLESEEIDVTTHDSEGDFAEFIAGTKDAGEVTVEGYLFKEEDFEALLVLANSREIKECTVTYPSGAVWAFSAFIKSLKDTEKTVEGVAGFNSTLRISGAPVYTKAAA